MAAQFVEINDVRKQVALREAGLLWIRTAAGPKSIPNDKANAVTLDEQQQYFAMGNVYYILVED